MVGETDRAFIEAAIEHFGSQSEDRGKRRAYHKGFDLLASALRSISKAQLPDRYLPIAQEIASIGRAFGKRMGSDTDAAIMSNAIQIASHIKGMGAGAPSGLAAPLLCWLWLNKRESAVAIFEKTDFKYEAEYRRIEERARPDVSGVLVAQQDRNRFNLAYLIDHAEARIVLVGQNHWYMVSQPAGGQTDFWPRIEAAVRRGVTVEIIAMHPNAVPPLPDDDPPDAIRLWSHYLKAPALPAHVDRCWQTLDRFAHAYRELHVREGYAEDRLNIYRAWFVPLSMTVIDPLSDNGMAVLSPRTPSEISGKRQEFVLRRKDHPDAFLYFWSFVDNGIANQGWQAVRGS